ncbi:hypothetical protein ZWY2020_057341 [Hordeum vulgare]|nr:hypothetical protein ZWY2020_057341 [Hordeum vulgare]
MRAPASLLHRDALATTGPTEPSASLVSMKAPEPGAAAAVNSNMVLILASLPCALVIHCACSRRRRSDHSPPPPKGLKKKDIDALPTVSFAAAAPPQSSSSSECAICLAEFTEGEALRVLPRCGHGFHVACVDAWHMPLLPCPHRYHARDAQGGGRCGGEQQV